jgi:hypothetical protein
VGLPKSGVKKTSPRVTDPMSELLGSEGETASQRNDGEKRHDKDNGWRLVGKVKTPRDGNQDRNGPKDLLALQSVLAVSL